jgi:hypothetical protein
MKAFVIFPAICIFLLTMSLLKVVGQTKNWATLLWSVVVTILFAGLMIWRSVDVIAFLYYSNFVGVLVCIPCLTYLTNRLLTRSPDKKISLIRLLVLGILSTVVTVGTAGLLIFMSFIFNPTDPPTNKQSTERRE